MAEIKVTALSPAAAVAKTDQLYGVVGGVSQRVSVDTLLASRAKRIDTLTALEAIIGPAADEYRYVEEINEFAKFYSGNQTARITADPTGVIWRPAQGVANGASGAWELLKRDVPTLADLLQIEPISNGDFRTVSSYHAASSKGGGQFVWDSTGDKADHNGGTVIDPDVVFPTDWSNQTQLSAWFTAGAGTGVWRKSVSSSVAAAEFGNKGDDSQFDSISFQAALDYVGDTGITLETLPSEIHIVDDLILSGKSGFALDIKGVLKRQDNLPAGGITRTLTIDQCDDFRIVELNLDGNHINNNCVEGGATYTTGGFNQEQRHGLVLEDCTDVRIGRVIGRNASGDTLYVTGPNTKNIVIESVDGYSYDALGDYIALGRNVVSIVEGEYIDIGRVGIYGVGHDLMPGGFDIEPNDGQAVKYVTVGSIRGVCSGSVPLGITTQYGAGANIIGVNIGLVSLISTRAGATRMSVLTGCTDVTIGDLNLTGSTGNEDAFGIHMGLAGTSQPCFDVDIRKAKVESCRFGVFSDNVTGFNIDIEVEDCHENLVRVYAVNDAKINVTGSFNAAATGEVFCVYFYGTDPINNVIISGDISRDTVGAAANRAVTTPKTALTDMVNCKFENLDITGWWVDNTSQVVVVGGALSAVHKNNCKGYLTSDINPYDKRNGIVVFAKGDFVKNTNPSELGTGGSMYVIEGWVAVADGTASTAGFLEQRVLTGN